MIQKINLQNFQAHENSTLDLHPGVNVITGQSDNGKSSIVRGLLWLFYNRSFSFEEIKRRGTAPKDWTSVTLTIGDHTVSRMRNRDVNKYVLDGQDLKAVGTNVPSEVLEVLPVSDVNAQAQMDSPYLLSNSPGEIARTFNALAGLQDIDTSLSSVKTRIIRTKTSISSINEQKSRVEMQMSQYENLDRIESLISTLESLSADIEDLDKSHDDLISMEVQLKECRERFVKYQDAKADKRLMIQLEDIEEKIEGIEKKIFVLTQEEQALDQCSQRVEMMPLLQSMQVDILTLKGVTSNLEKFSQIVSELESCQAKSSGFADTQKDLDDLNHIREMVRDVTEMDRKFSHLSRLEKEWKTQADQIEAKKVEEETLREDLENLLKEVGVCPLCGSNL